MLNCQCADYFKYRQLKPSIVSNGSIDIRFILQISISYICGYWKVEIYLFFFASSIFFSYFYFCRHKNMMLERKMKFSFCFADDEYAYRHSILRRENNNRFLPFHCLCQNKSISNIGIAGELVPLYLSMIYISQPSPSNPLPPKLVSFFKKKK